MFYLVRYLNRSNEACTMRVVASHLTAALNDVTSTATLVSVSKEGS